MASDSIICQGDSLVGQGKKITKTKNGILAGAAGNFRDVTLFLDIIESGVPEDEDFAFGPETKFENLGGIIVYPNNTVYVVDNSGYPFKMEAEFHTSGVGADLALGALAMGATAVEAVEVAIKYSMGCGGAIQVVSLKE